MNQHLGTNRYCFLDLSCDLVIINLLKIQPLTGAAEDCRRQGIAFLPLAVESFGGWHSAAVGEVKKLGAALARQTGQEEGEAVGHLWGRLSILLQRGNAAILGNRVPVRPAPHIDGVV